MVDRAKQREMDRVLYKKFSEKAIFDVLLEEAFRLYKEKGWLTVPFIIEKEGSKYLKKPVGRWNKLKDGEISLQEYWQSLSIKEELFVSGIGIITGKASGVTVLDIDDPKKFEERTGLKLEELLRRSLAVKTISKGYHLYFKYDSEIKTGTYQSLGFDVRNDGALAVIPPSFCLEEPPKEVVEALGLSIEVDGPKYEWVNDGKITEIPEKLKRLLLGKEVLEPKEGEKTSIYKLSDDKIIRIAELFVPLWKKGYRNSLTIYLLGLLYKSGVDKESAEKLLDRITTIASDEEKNQRLAQVRYQYEVYLPRKPFESIKGWKGITEILEELKAEGVIKEEGANYILSKLQEIFPYDREAVKTSKVYVVTGFEPKRGFVNDARNCFISSWRETQDGWKLKNIYLFTAVVDLVINYEPFKEQKTYIATFVKISNKERKTFVVEGSLDEIYAKLRSESLVVREDAKAALATIFNEFEKRGLAKITRKVSLRGIILNEEGKLELNKHFLPELNPEKIKEALELLNQYFEEFARDKKAEVATVLKWALVSPFNWVKKQKGKKTLFKWLFLLGSPDTGKTTDAELFTRWIWGLEENSTSGASLQTLSRIGQKASRWTFANLVNEASTLFKNTPHSDEVREMLRQTWDGTIAREIRKNTGERIVELAGATFIFTANENPIFYPADAKRIEIIKYNPKARVTREEKLIFEKKFNPEKKSIFAYIGRAVFEWAKENLNLILGVDDYKTLGELILEDLYDKYYGEKPDWIYLSAEEVEEEELLPTKEDILAILVKVVNQTLGGKYGFDIARGRIPILKRLIMAKNLDPTLPYEVDERNGILYIKRGFLQLVKEHGYQVASLIDLAQILEAEYKRVHNERLGLKGNKVVAINLRALEIFNGQEVKVFEETKVFELPEKEKVEEKNLEEVDILDDDRPPPFLDNEEN